VIILFFRTSQHDEKRFAKLFFLTITLSFHFNYYLTSSG